MIRPPVSGRVAFDKETLQHLIPFHLIWNGAGELARISDAVLRVWNSAPDQMPRVCLQRPFQSPLESWMFPELTGMVLTVSPEHAPGRSLRGELIALEENQWLFTGVPAISRVADLELAGLRLSDLPLHTGFGDALIATEAAQTSLKLSESEKQRLEAANRLLSAMDEAFGTPASRPESENYFRALIENSSDITVIVDEQGVIRYVSPSVMRVLGYTPRSLLGKTIRETVDPSDTAVVLGAIDEVIHAGATRAPVQFRFKAPDGSWRHLEAVGRVLGEDSGTAQVVMNARDVTDRMSLEQRLRQAQKMESIGRLAGGVAHDFNNLLTVIQGHAALLQMSNELSSESAESAQEIIVAAERAATLTRQLLTFSRKQTLRTRTLGVRRLVEGTASMLRRILGDDIALEVEIAPGPLAVCADEGMMEQVLMTLSANSRDAMPNGGRLIINASPVTFEATEIHRNPEARPGSFVRLSVADTGGGISPENLGRIFEPFFTTKEFGRGTGLGLATVHGILKLHGGWVEVDTEVDRGTVFRTYWPTTAPSDGDPATATAENGTGATRPGRGDSGTILVVEDEAPLRELVREILERQGFEVVTAKSGAEALRIWPAHRDRIGLLLTDIVMPEGVSGWDLAQRLRADRAGLPVIYTSGYSPDMVDQEGRLLEGEVFLQKPYDPVVLLETVRARIRVG